MQKRRVILILLGLLGAGAIVVLCRPERHASYGGKKLSEWVEMPGWPDGTLVILPNGVRAQILERWPRQDEASDAVKHIGTNGLPYLLKWARYEPPAWKTRAFAFINKTFRSNLIDRKAFRAAGAFSALSILDQQAEGAVPSLALLMNETSGANRPVVLQSPFVPGNTVVMTSANAPNRLTRGSSAFSVLSGLSLSVLAADMVFMTNASASVRLQSVERLRTFGTRILPAVPALIHCLQDPDVEVAVAAAKFLGDTAVEPRLVVPALTDSLQRPVVRKAAIHALAAFGAQARPAVPALTALLKDPVPVVSRLATNALRQIDPDAVERATE